MQIKKKKKKTAACIDIIIVFVSLMTKRKVRKADFDELGPLIVIFKNRISLGYMTEKVNTPMCIIFEFTIIILG